MRAQELVANHAARDAPLLRVLGLEVRYGAHKALHGVSFELRPAETVGLVGESGCGKSTLARALLRLVPSQGRIEWRGAPLPHARGPSLRAVRRDLQMIFQDPHASLDPRMAIGEAIEEPLRSLEPGMGAEPRARSVAAMLEAVGLRAADAPRYPHELSGGQCQRVAIARAMILKPRLLVCDEPVSSLDVSIQGQIVNLLLDMRREHGTALLFISHNLAVVRQLSHRILVMQAGSIVETAARDALFAAPTHPYTRALLAAVPVAPRHEPR